MNNNNETAAFICILVDTLSSMQQAMSQGIKEYELLQLLQKPPYCLFDEEALGATDTLFRAHFLLFHGLYLLRRQWRTQGVGELEIHTTNIQLLPFERNEKALENADPLEAYYLDLNTLASTSSEDIDSLIADFWQMMQGQNVTVVSQKSIEDAHEVLRVPYSPDDQPSGKQLKTAYRKRLHQIHPDKGGSVEDAKALIAAYNDLLRYYTALPEDIYD